MKNEGWWKKWRTRGSCFPRVETSGVGGDCDGVWAHYLIDTSYISEVDYNVNNLSTPKQKEPMMEIVVKSKTKNNLLLVFFLGPTRTVKLPQVRAT